MKIKPTKTGTAASMIILLVMAFAGICYAWFISLDEGTDDSAMGLVDIAISEQSEVTDGILSFTITNHSQIDTYMRLGWTPVIHKDGRATTKDISGIAIDKVEPVGIGNPEAPVYHTGQITSLNGYQKNTIIPEDGDGKYFVVPAHTDISGVITVDGWQRSEGETLHLVLIPEAVQATQKAVEAAGEYGWQTERVGAQAGSIVSFAHDGNQRGGD